jgi:FAD/FMN-containing dehydrogenase/Fe-S oxidoreductase
MKQGAAMLRSLPVISSSFASSPIGGQLQQLDVGEVRLGRHDRLLYSTDASLYQIEPLGVVIPSNVDQIQRLLKVCRDQHVSILPRGGGTSLAGQCTGKSLVLDLSPRFRRVWDVDIEHKRCKAEAGVVPDWLNRELTAKQSGLFFAPDPATTAQASIGGCIGNNAAGARSIRYGRTSENIAAIDVVLASGERFWMTPRSGRTNSTAAKLAVDVAHLVQQSAALIRARIPKLIRRNAGYGLDLILDQLDQGVTPEDLDLCGLLCGSEGTLAIVLAAELKLHRLPIARGLAIVSFGSIDAAIDAVPAILGTHPSAVELLDRVVLDAARGNAECSRYLSLFPNVGTDPLQAVLYVEYQSETDTKELGDRFDELRRTLPGAAMVIHLDAGSIASAWALRKAGEALLHGMSATKKPVTFVEDNSIPVENLSRFVREFRRIVESHGTGAAFYAHASVGVLHVRPMIDLREPAGLRMMQSIAVEVADLARDCGGVMSGEHGDGKARGPLLERFYGPEMMQVFGQLKRLFDPENLLNPGNIVDAGPIQSITQNLRVEQEKGADSHAIETYFDYQEQEGFRSAVEMCNGAGFCRKTAGGTMCPSYRATLDERHSTRGRGNALRLAITGQLSADGKAAWDDVDTLETLDLCLSCKACKTECPSNVDVSRLKAEYLAQRFKSVGKPLAARGFGHIRQINRIGSSMPGLTNWMLQRKWVRASLERLFHLSPKRTLPKLGPSLFRWFDRRKRPSPPASPNILATQRAPRVLLFGDCFTAFNEPRIGRSAVNVLEQLGYEVLVPDLGCCGRPMISEGLLDDAIRSADRVIRAISPFIADASLAAIVVCEPSCLSAIKDDWLQLKLTAPIALRRQIAERAMLVEDFVNRQWDMHPRRPSAVRMDQKPVCLHGHCHQKALWGDQTSSSILRRLSSGPVEVLPSGCCGMAGAFGYASDKYDLSMKIGELSVFGPIRAASEQTLIVAPGTSCRHQIRDGTGRIALHPIQVVEQWLNQQGDKS